MSETPSARRWFQFDLRTLMLIVTIVAVWLAWRYAPPPKPESALADTLKVGDRIVLRERDGMYTLIVPSDPQSYRLSDQFTVDFVDAEVVRLKNQYRTSAIRIEKIARVDRWNPPKPPSATASNSGGPGEMDFDGMMVDVNTSGVLQPRETNSAFSPAPGGSSLVPGGALPEEVDDESDPVPPPPAVNENGS